MMSASCKKNEFTTKDFESIANLSSGFLASNFTTENAKLSFSCLRSISKGKYLPLDNLSTAYK